MIEQSSQTEPILQVIALSPVGLVGEERKKEETFEQFSKLPLLRYGYNSGKLLENPFFYFFFIHVKGV